MPRVSAANSPPFIHPAYRSVTDIVGPWIVVHTMSCRERRVAQECIWKNVPYILPMEPVRVKDARGRRFDALRPFFPGYLFVAGFDASLIRSAEAVCNFIHTLEQDRLIAQLLKCEHACRADPVIIEHERALKLEGRHVEVVSGPFRGRFGQVESIRRTVVTLRIDVLGQSCDVEVDAEDVEPI